MPQGAITLIGVLMQKNSDNYNGGVILEGMTSISAVINGLRAGMEGRTIRTVYYDREKEHAKARELGFLRAVSGELGFSLTPCSAEEIDELANGNTHGGIVALCSERPIQPLERSLEQSEAWSRTDGFFVLLEGIEDPYNFGYALRSLYAAGADGIVLCPRNWMSAAGVVARSSAGASELLPMAECEPSEAARLLKARGYRVVCAGIRDSVPLYSSDMRRPLLLVIGGEKRGISRAVLSEADKIVKISYGRDFSAALSAASATTILAYEIAKQNRK